MFCFCCFFAYFSLQILQFVLMLGAQKILPRAQGIC